VGWDGLRAKRDGHRAPRGEWPVWLGIPICVFIAFGPRAPLGLAVGLPFRGPGGRFLFPPWLSFPPFAAFTASLVPACRARGPHREIRDTSLCFALDQPFAMGDQPFALPNQPFASDGAFLSTCILREK
jgi:hypothetical protein